MRNRFLIFCVVFAFSIGITHSQFKDLGIEFGLIPTSIFGNNSASEVFQSQNKETIGGGFFGFQTGIFVKAVWQFENSPISIPFGLEYVFYRAYHRVPLAPNVTFYIKHFIDVPTLTLGFRYDLFKLPFANVKAYTELDAMGNFVGKSNYNIRIDYESYDSTVIRSVSNKNAVFRLGTGIKLGFLGEIVHPWYANLFVSVNYVNLFGKNNKRGELLTPDPRYETVENPVYNFQLAVSLMYKF
ncbi:MAG: hypothetical protein ACPLPX_08130 [Candidatus Kapaibacteriota bacterium]